MRLGAVRPAAPRALDQAELALAEPGDNGINTQLAQVLGRLARPRQRAGATRPRARRWSSRRSALADAFSHGRRPARRSSRRRRSAEYDDRAPAGPAPGGEIEQIATRDRASSTTRSSARHRAATRRTTCWTAATCCSTSSPRSARSRSTDSGDGSVSCVDTLRRARRYAARRRHHRHVGRPPAGDAWSPGGRLGAPARALACPAARIDSYRTDARRRSPRSLADAVNASHAGDGGTFFTSTDARTPQARSRSRRASTRRARSRAGPAPAGRQRHRAARSPRCAAARPTAPTAPSSPASAPTCARPRARRPTPRRSPTPSRTAARASPASRSTRR